MKIIRSLFFPVFVLVCLNGAAQSFTINTVMGNGYPGFGGDGCYDTCTTSCMMESPYGVASDDSGNVYIADWGNNMVRKVNRNGIISTYAGQRLSGYAGDGGPANIAKLNHPTGVAVDKSGNVYIADDSNSVIRKVTTKGIISTVAGIGISGFGGDGGLATVANLSYPTGVAADDSGNIFIADQVNNRIRKVNTSGIIITVAGNGTKGYNHDGISAITAELNLPYGCAVDSSGNIYIADTKNNRVRFVNKSGIISTIAGTGVAYYSGDNGLATAARINNPFGVTIDKSGNVYIADTYNNCLRKIDTKGIITTHGGNTISGYMGDGGPDTLSEMSQPYGVTTDGSKNIYVADMDNNRVRRIDTNNIITNFAGSGQYGYLGDGSPAISSVPQLYFPNSTFVDKKGNIFIADWDNNRVRKINPNGIVSTFAGNGSVTESGDSIPAISAGVGHPAYITEDSSGNVYITDGNNRIRKVDTHGIITTIAGGATRGYSGDGGPARLAQTYYPQGILVDKFNNIYFADETNNVIRKINTAGIITTVVGNGFDAGTGVGGYTGDGGPATAAEMDQPVGIAMDRARNIYIAEWRNHIIRKVDTNGIISTFAGNGGSYADGIPATAAEFYDANDVAVDSLGRVYTIDASTNEIRMINKGGIINTICGKLFINGYTGDGGPAIDAELSDPVGASLDAKGNIYVADYSNNCIRKLTPNLLGTTVVINSEVTCFGGNNGSVSSITGGGASPYTYSWSNGGTKSTAGGLSVGTYTVTVLDAHQDTAKAIITITQPYIVFASVNTVKNVSCVGGNNGSAEVSVKWGSPPYTYLWSDGSTNALDTGLSAGAYTVVVTDSCGNSSTTGAGISQPYPLVVIANAYNTCANGRTKATPYAGTPPYTYLWSGGGGTNAIATGLSAGMYTVTLSDSCGGTATASVTVTQSTPLHVSISLTKANCDGTGYFIAYSNISGGTTPYTYSWSDGQTSANGIGLSAGTYTLTVSDSCGNTATAVTTAILHPPLSVLTDSTEAISGCNGAASITVSGGVVPYTYFWTTGHQTTDSISNQCAGTYCCIITDNYGCTQTSCVTIINGYAGTDKVTSDAGQITVYPNPGNGVFTIQLPVSSEQLTVEVYNVLGEKVYSNNYQPITNSYQLLLNNQPNGLYLVRVITYEGKTMGQIKIIKSE